MAERVNIKHLRIILSHRRQKPSQLMSMLYLFLSNISKIVWISFHSIINSNFKRIKEPSRVSFRDEDQEAENEMNREDELAQSSEHQQGEANSTSQSGSSGANQAGGTAAAGFKKFIKKSISIRIKQNDQVGGTDSNEKPQQQQMQDAKEDLKQQYHRMITSGSKAQLNLKSNERKNPNDEVTNELKSLLELDNRSNMAVGDKHMLGSGVPMNQHLPPPHLQHQQQQQQYLHQQMNPMQQYNDFQR